MDKEDDIYQVTEKVVFTKKRKGSGEIRRFASFVRAKFTPQQLKVFLRVVQGQTTPLHEYVIQWEKFIELCSLLADPNASIQMDETQILTYVENEDEYYWYGIGDSKLPTFGAFLRRLFELHVIHIPPRKKTEFIQSALYFFHLPSDKENAKFVGKSMDDLTSSHRELFRNLLK